MLILISPVQSSPGDINALTERVIGCAYSVPRTLGAGFLEKVYENALRIELEDAGFAVKQQRPLSVRYRDRIVGEFLADLIIERRLLIELKAARMLAKEHEVQLVNYLTATGLDDGLLVIFGTSVEVKRKFSQYKERTGSKARDHRDGIGGDLSNPVNLGNPVQ